LLTPHELTEGLERLKLALVAMRPDEYEAREFEATRRQISAIRLQLKRLEVDREAMRIAVEKTNPSAG
jgi:hypothetical protein